MSCWNSHNTLVLSAFFFLNFSIFFIFLFFFLFFVFFLKKKNGSCFLLYFKIFWRRDFLFFLIFCSFFHLSPFSKLRFFSFFKKKVKIDSWRSVSGMPKRAIQAVLCHRHGYLQKYSKQHDVTCRCDSYSPRSRMENSLTCAQSVTRDDEEDVSKRQRWI